MQEAKINLGKVVRVARKRKRITQDYLAEKVGVQPRTILEIENGRGNPRFENLFVMVRLLEIQNSFLTRTFCINVKQPIIHLLIMKQLNCL